MLVGFDISNDFNGSLESFSTRFGVFSEHFSVNSVDHRILKCGGWNSPDQPEMQTFLWIPNQTDLNQTRSDTEKSFVTSV